MRGRSRNPSISFTCTGLDMVNVCDIDSRVYSVVLCFVAIGLTWTGRSTPGEHAMLPIGGRPSLGVYVRTRIWCQPGQDPASAGLITLDLGARLGRCHSPRNPAIGVHGSSAHPRGSKSSVTPAQAGVQVRLVDSRLRGNDRHRWFFDSAMVGSRESEKPKPYKRSR